jgi:predicted RNA-binding Zn ribbon-like protein
VHDGVRAALTRVLIAVTAAAAGDTRRRVKVCSSAECSWAFYDASKNRSRNWCEWGCGNRIKTRNFRARQRGRAAG